MDRWVDGRTVDGWVFGGGRVSRSVNGWMNESLGGWINCLEGELCVWVVKGRMELHGMGAWLAGGVTIAWMKKMSFHLPASHSASLSKIALCTPLFSYILPLSSPPLLLYSILRAGALRCQMEVFPGSSAPVSASVLSHPRCAEI